jgi:hypothetical protein
MEIAAMDVIRMTATPDSDGALHLTIPVGKKNGLFEVEVVVVPNTANSNSNWPPGYFERTYGAVADDSFRAPERAPTDPVEPLG